MTILLAVIVAVVLVNYAASADKTDASKLILAGTSLASSTGGAVKHDGKQSLRTGGTTTNEAAEERVSDLTHLASITQHVHPNPVLESTVVTREGTYGLVPRLPEWPISLGDEHKPAIIDAVTLLIENGFPPGSIFSVVKAAKADTWEGLELPLLTYLHHWLDKSHKAYTGELNSKDMKEIFKSHHENFMNSVIDQWYRDPTLPGDVAKKLRVDPENLKKTWQAKWYENYLNRYEFEQNRGLQ